MKGHLSPGEIKVDLDSFLEKIAEATAPEGVLHGLSGSSKALALVEIHRRVKRPFLVVLPTQPEAEAFARDLIFFLGPETVTIFPEREVPPYQPRSPEIEIRGERYLCWKRLAFKEARMVVSSAPALLERLPPPEVISSAFITLYPKRIIHREDLIRALLEGGYRHVSQVVERGEYSLRGGILDFFPPTSGHPVRIEFFGDEISSMREFEVDSQRSLGPIEKVTLFPVSEVLLTEARCRQALEKLDRMVLETGCPMSPPIREALERRGLFPGIENYLPLFYEGLVTLFDYLDSDSWIAIIDPSQVRAKIQEFWIEVLREEKREKATGTLVCHHRDLYLSPEELNCLIHSRKKVLLESLPLPPSPEDHPPSLAFNVQSIAPFQGRMERLAEEVRSFRQTGFRVNLVCLTEDQARRLEALLGEFDIGVVWEKRGGIRLSVGSLSSGFIFPALGEVYITQKELFGPRFRPRHRRRPKEALPFTSFEDLKYGDYVVHVDHGIGQYKGLRHLKSGGIAGDYLYVKYAGNDRLYVPVDKFHLVQRYIGGGPPPLNRLGGTSWAKTKERVRASIREMARELLELYASRQVLPGYAFSPDTPWQREFEAAFPYEETSDQLQAIEEVKKDMETPRVMDRLVCGDVGYGKTEVALRAAFKAVMDGKQVAVLVPTTVLALQHGQTFSERFSSFPVVVEVLSRFRSKKEQRNVLKGLREGTVDIVIGTHRLLQRDVSFKDLGLLVIDEEQRFGVAAKEKLKKLKKQVDVLTLTATPIPRTLHMSLLGVRDITLIETPPEDRLSIHTYVSTFDDQIIREAIEKELERNGQVFFVHNRIESIYAMEARLRRLFPHARIAVAHGQMKEKDLERVMCDFYARKYDLLLSTAIVESGLDIPNANTIIIDRADTLGLAQLYQLRGRVGRDKHRAYAYLLVPPEGGLGEIARKRLQVISELTELGSGFKIAARDLEIRGGGNLLGPEQHGHIAAVGYDLYCQLIESTIKELRGIHEEPEIEPNIKLKVEAYLPETYIPDPNIRLNLYKRLLTFRSVWDLGDFHSELEDRFGEPPGPARILLQMVELKIIARQLKIQKIVRTDNKVRITFGDPAVVKPEKVVALLTREAERFQYIPENTLELRLMGRKEREDLVFIKNLLHQLT